MIKTNLDNVTKEQKEKFFKEFTAAHQILFDSVKKRLVTEKICSRDIRNWYIFGH